MKYLSPYKNYIKEFLNTKKDDIPDEHLLNITSEEELYSILKEYDIDLSKWGIGRYKTVSQLFKEIKEGECVLYGFNGILRREVNFVGARVIYMIDKIRYVLTEDRSIFKDGRVRVRDIWYSMAEKFKFGEDHEEALIRGMEEELGIVVNGNQCFFYNKLRFQDNGDFPGLESYHNGYSYLVLLNEEQYKEEGYIEHQSDKDIYFTWRKSN